MRIWAASQAITMRGEPQPQEWRRLTLEAASLGFKVAFSGSVRVTLHGPDGGRLLDLSDIT